MFNVIVDAKNRDLDGFIQVNRIEDVSSIKGSIDYLIIGPVKSSQKYLTEITKLFDTPSRPKNLVYIADNENVDSKLKTFVMGLKGYYFDDEFFLEDSNELSNLLNSKEEVNSLVSLPGEEILKDFKKKFDRGEVENSTPQYLQVVSSALSSIVKEYSRKQNEVMQISQETIEIFKDINKVSESTNQELNELQEQLDSVMKQVENSSFGGITSFDYNMEKNVTFFPRVAVREGSKRVLKIKDIGHTKYLTSFLLGFVKYLYEVAYLKPKLVFIEDVNEASVEIYKNYTYITKDNFQRGELFSNREVLFVNHPTINVMNLLLAEDTKDIFIIVDRTSFYKNHLLKGNGVFVSANSINVLRELKVPKDLTISSSKGDVFMKLFEIEGYSDDITMRERQYLDKYRDSYEKLLRRVL